MLIKNVKLLYSALIRIFTLVHDFHIAIKFPHPFDNIFLTFSHLRNPRLQIKYLSLFSAGKKVQRSAMINFRVFFSTFSTIIWSNNKKESTRYYNITKNQCKPFLFFCSYVNRFKRIIFTTKLFNKK